ncbi:dUTP diphosphatase [Desulforegula conservatrix]|uniref:dUTP diphosphatase n=1 Tax=Desulforegula conservatrix TaxID=153026 RepID=UPI0003FA61D0|nr:dUTP diphosphatase [Desulforegula conservatrix]
MPEIPLLKIVRLRPDQDADIPIPRYMTPGSAGMDLCAAVNEDTVIEPGDIFLVPTGFAMAIPQGYEGEIRPRSGLAVKFGITLINSPGTVDADYREEVKVAIINLGKAPFVLKRGDRVAQMLIKKVYQVTIDEVEKLSKTERTGGFGHTGI